MTDLPEVSLVHKMFDLLASIQIRNLENSFIYGRILWELGVKNKTGKKLYKLRGAHIECQKDLAKELGFKSVSQLHNLVEIWQTFEPFAKDDNGQLLPIKPTKLVELLPLNLPEENRTEWCKKAATLNAEAFENEIRNHKGLIGTDQCEHGDCETMAKCKVCGKMMKVV